MVGHWLYNQKHNIKNEEVLLIVYDRFNKNLLGKIDESIRKEYNILEFSKYQLHKTNNFTQENIILLVNNKILLSDLKELQNKILLISLSSLYVETLEEFLNKIDINTFSKKPELSSIEKHQYYIEQNDPIEIIEKHLDTLESFLFNRFNNLLIKDAHLHNFLRNTNLETEGAHLVEKDIKLIIIDDVNTHTKKPDSVIADESLQKEYLKRDIAILKEKGILTSRLSIVIYRNEKLDLYANPTEIGRYYSRIFSRSKVVDLKKISQDSSVNYDGLSKTIVKAYNINNKVNTEKKLEMRIKEEIVKKILCNTSLDIDTIQKIVELPKETLIGYKREVESKAI
jgi:hypothetical protein